MYRPLLPVSPETADAFLWEPFLVEDLEVAIPKLSKLLLNHDNSLYHTQKRFKDLWELTDGAQTNNFNTGHTIGFKILDRQAASLSPGGKLFRVDSAKSQEYIGQLKDAGTDAADFLLEHEDEIKDRVDPEFYRALGGYIDIATEPLDFRRQDGIKLGGLALYKLIAYQFEQREVAELDQWYELEA